MGVAAELRRHPLSSFGTVVLVVLFQRGFAFYASLGFDYEVPIALSGAVAWLIFPVLLPHATRRALFGFASALLSLAFLVQEGIVWSVFYGIDETPLALAACVAFGVGWAMCSWLWVEALGRRDPASVLVCVATGSALTALIACVPPVLLGSGSLADAAASASRLVGLFATLCCLHRELEAAGASQRCGDLEVEPCAPRMQPASEREVLTAISLVVAGVLAARFVQGVFFLEEFPYREYGSAALLVASPLLSALLVAIVARYRGRASFAPALYWLVVTCSLLALLVVVGAMGGALSPLWLLLFTVFAQVDVIFFAMLASVPHFFGGRFLRLTCLSFAAKELAFLAGNACKPLLGIGDASLLSALLLLLVASVLIVGFLHQLLSRGPSSQSSLPLNEVVSRSLARRFELTARETEVLSALLQGRSYTSIGQKLFISKSTVKSHANHIYAKVGVSSRDELIEYLDEHATS